MIAERIYSCETCGREFKPRRCDARHCGPACRQKAYRRRNGSADTTPSGAIETAAAVPEWEADVIEDVRGRRLDPLDALDLVADPEDRRRFLADRESRRAERLQDWGVVAA